MTALRRTLPLLAALLCAGVGVRIGEAKDYVPPELKAIAVDQRLGARVDEGLAFVDQDGRAVTLGQYLDGERPVLLTLNYYGCKMLCSLQLNALLPALKGSGLRAGPDYRIVTVSIDPREGPEVARGKRATYLAALDRGDADWSFLTGGQEAIAALASSVGFKYAYDEKSDQFAHGAAIYFLSPRGVITRYLFGLQYLARDVRFALLEAADGRLGSIVDTILLSCFHYDAELGSYVAVAWRVMRLGGVAIVLVLSAFLSAMWRVELKRRAAEVLGT